MRWDAEKGEGEMSCGWDWEEQEALLPLMAVFLDAKSTSSSSSSSFSAVVSLPFFAALPPLPPSSALLPAASLPGASRADGQGGGQGRAEGRADPPSQETREKRGAQNGHPKSQGTPSSSPRPDEKAPGRDPGTLTVLLVRPCGGDPARGGLREGRDHS